MDSDTRLTIHVIRVSRRRAVYIDDVRFDTMGAGPTRVDSTRRYVIWSVLYRDVSSSTTYLYDGLRDGINT